MRIELSPLEYMHAAQAGFLRQASNLCRGRRDAHGFSGDGYDAHVLGAVGEFVAARALGLLWGGAGGLRGPDAGGNVQVRTRSRPDYELIVHPGDPGDGIFVLVTAGRSCLEWDVRRWIRGEDAKSCRWCRDPARGRPACFVPHASLRPVAELGSAAA